VPTPTPTRAPGAATPQPGQPGARYDQFLDALARRLGVTADRLRQAIGEARQDLGLPASGPGPFGPFDRHPGFPFGGRGFGHFSLDVAAQAIGIPAEQLRQELPGKTLADVARAHNVDPNRVADALKADAAARVDQAQRDGRLTAEQAAQAKQQANARVDSLMTQQLPLKGRRAPGAPGSPTPTPGATQGTQRT
jgi:transposase-like protein